MQKQQRRNKKHTQNIKVLREEEGRRKRLNLIHTESYIISVQHFMYCLLFLVPSTLSSKGSHQLHSMKTFLIFTFLLTYSFFFCICNVINIHSLAITSVTFPSIGYTLCIQSTFIYHPFILGYISSSQKYPIHTPYNKDDRCIPLYPAIFDTAAITIFELALQSHHSKAGVFRLGSKHPWPIMSEILLMTHQHVCLSIVASHCLGQ